MSRARTIRDYMRGKEPMGSAEIAAAIGLPALPVQHSIGNMVHAGIIKCEGVGRCLRYSLARDVITVRKTPEQLRARKNERERERSEAKRRMQGKPTQAEYFAWKAECAAERKRQTAERKAQRKKDQQERRAFAKLVSKHARLVAKIIKPTPVKTPRKPTAAQQVHIVPAKPLVTAVARPKARVETVAEWMARTGKRPQVLPIGAMSQPLKFAGHKGMAKESWERSGRKAA